MKERLDNSAETKAYLEGLPKVFAKVFWADFVVLEFPWSGGYDKFGMPLVYNYYDGNGCYDEYRLMPINHVSSGYIDWFKN